MISPPWFDYIRFIGKYKGFPIFYTPKEFSAHRQDPKNAIKSKSNSIYADYFGDNPIQLIGNFNTVTNQNANTQILMDNAKITSLNLEAAANITGTGSIKTANISQEASNSALPVKPGKTLGDGADDVKIAGGTGSPSTSTGTDTSSGPKTTHYSVTFNLNGKTGTAIASQSVADGNYATVPSTSPSAAGYIFEGWYADAAGTTAFSFTTTTIKGNTTIYAKWSTTAALLCDALTFDLIKGSNENEQSITGNLSLITALDGATISWSSSDTAHLSATGTVTRPSDDDIQVTLTATITYGGETATKDFVLIIRNETIDNVTVDYIDEYFEDGYPNATIENGDVVVYFKLVEAAEVYITADASNATNWDSSVKGVLEGHADTYNGDTDPSASVYVNNWGYEKVSDTSSVVSVDTGVTPVSGNKLKVNLVIKDGTYTSSAVTTIEFDIATATAADTNPPYFHEAYINYTDDTIYLYGNEPLDLSSVPAIDDFTITDELDEPAAEVTGVSLHNSGDWPESWIELSIENTSSSSLYVSYEPGTNKIQDEMGNDCTGFSDVLAESAQTDIEDVSVNLEASTMKIDFAPGFNSIGDMNITTSDFTVTNGGVALENLVRIGNSYNLSQYSAYFIFNPVMSGSEDIEVTFTSQSGIKNAAFEDVGDLEYSGTVSYYHKVSPSSISAEYDDLTHSIELTFDPDIELNSARYASWNFRLNVNGTSYQMRGFDGERDRTSGNVVKLDVGNHIPTLSNTDTVTLTYDPITDDSSDMLSDPSGYCLDGFGPINVSIKIYK